MRRPSPRFDVSLDIQVLLILMAGFGFLAFLSLLAISGWVPWMREQVTFFDAASEANLWTWANVAVLVSGADAHFVIACRTRNRDRRSALGWLVSAGLLALLSLDDLASVHERLEGIGRHFGGGIGLLHFAWIVPGALVAIVTAGLFMTLILRLRGRPRYYLLSGVVIFFLAAVGLEAVGGYILDSVGYGLAYVAEFHIEELLEALGATLMLCSALAHPELRDAIIRGQ